MADINRAANSTLHSASKSSRKVNLPRDFHKAACWIQMLAGFVLRHRFDHGVGQTFAAEIIQRVFDEPASQGLTAELRRDGEVGNPTFAALAIHSRADVTGDAALSLSHEDTGGVARDVF